MRSLAQGLLAATLLACAAALQTSRAPLIPSATGRFPAVTRARMPTRTQPPMAARAGLGRPRRSPAVTRTQMRTRTQPLMATPIVASAAASIARVSEMEACRRLCIAVLAGAAIGFERTILYVQERGQRRHNMARTMALVSLGSATFTLASLAGLPYSDPARVVATIVSGVGFLGVRH